MFMIACGMLQESGLLFDWKIILVAYEGFWQHKMSAAEVISCALDRVGYGTEEQDHVAALLANTEPQDWQTITRYLEELAGQEPLDRSLSLRQLRYAELKRFLGVDPSAHDAWGEDEAFSLFDNLVDFWLSYIDLPDSTAMIPEYGSSARDMLRDHRQWMKHEGGLLGAVDDGRPDTR